MKTYQETAMFGELTYSFNDQLDLTVGARSLHYDFTQYKEDWGFVYGDTNRATSNVLDLTADDSDTSIKVTGSYQLSEDGQIYATYSDGSRPGVGNRSIPRSTDASNSAAYACDQDLNALGINGSPDVYKGDSVKNNEFGIKTMLNDSIRFNAAIYRMTWENIQQSVTTSGACGFNFTANLDEAESTGAEIEMNAAVNDNLNINFSLGYTGAEFKQNVASAGISSGDQLGDVPELTYNINVDYVIPADGGQFFIVGNYNWVDETLELPGLASDDVSGQGIISGNLKPDYGILGLRAGFTSDNNWEAVVFIDNATDETAIYSYSDAIVFNLPLYDRTVRNQPRTIGMNVTYSW
ncbi:TonB-dependent receptor [bacterium]|nr:TonB-dependent receptor [Porticoccaceae bacterium]MDC3261606.1 TonB-dependent receptor [bacterium]